MSRNKEVEAEGPEANLLEDGGFSPHPPREAREGFPSPVCGFEAGVLVLMLPSKNHYMGYLVACFSSPSFPYVKSCQLSGPRAQKCL